MRIFGHSKNQTNSGGCVVYGQIRGKIDSALTLVFTEEGKKAVLFYMTEKCSLTLEQASADPRRLENALTDLIGEVGWMAVKRKILEQFDNCPAKQSFAEMKGASLSDVFSAIQSSAVSGASCCSS
jgi:hypothetical protein